jgi:L-ascorbate metabolism protein UlaG (beta-lactamase superfamily)
MLRGLVELGYDINNHASLRFIEPLLYRSEHYVARHQAVFLCEPGPKARPFAMSTPLIDPSGGVLIHLPFAHGIYDTLARARHEGISAEELDLAVQALPASQGAALASMFTTVAPPKTHLPTNGETLRMRYFGHAAVLLETADVSVMLDPSLGYPSNDGVDKFSYFDLPPVIDYVLLTHNHLDHVLFETLLSLRHRIRRVVVPRSNGGSIQDPSIKAILRQVGFESVVELGELEDVPIAGGRIIGLPFLGEHSDLHIGSKLGYMVDLLGNRVMFLADSNNLDQTLYARLAAELPSADVIFIGMECAGAPMSWLYGDLMPRRLKREFDQGRRLDGSNFERARGIIDQFTPHAAFVYAMGSEPWLTHVMSTAYTDESEAIVESNKLIAYCEGRGMRSERLLGKREMVLNRNQLTMGAP